jgi:hypothetical protein
MSIRLDYHNGLLTGATQRGINNLQLMQNSVTRLITRSPCSSFLLHQIQSAYQHAQSHLLAIISTLPAATRVCIGASTFTVYACKWGHALPNAICVSRFLLNISENTLFQFRLYPVILYQPTVSCLTMP